MQNSVVNIHSGTISSRLGIPLQYKFKIENFLLTNRKKGFSWSWDEVFNPGFGKYQTLNITCPILSSLDFFYFLGESSVKEIISLIIKNPEEIGN